MPLVCRCSVEKSRPVPNMGLLSTQPEVNRADVKMCPVPCKVSKSVGGSHSGNTRELLQRTKQHYPYIKRDKQLRTHCLDKSTCFSCSLAFVKTQQELPSMPNGSVIIWREEVL